MPTSNVDVTARANPADERNDRSHQGSVRHAAQGLLRLAGCRVSVLRPIDTLMRPTVSVVIPCYNYGHYLSSCVSSVLSQADVALQVIIVDDCSPDGSGAIAEQIAADDDRVRVIRHARNRGHIITYNDGLAAATGEYAVLLSADDLLTEGALSRAVALMAVHPSVGFVYGRSVHFIDDPPPTNAVTSNWLVWRGEDWLRVRCRAGYNCIASPEVVMRTDVLRRVGSYREDLPHSGDLELWMRAATVADVGYVVGADQALYRQHPVNMHKVEFRSDVHDGRVVDLEHRWRAFDAALGIGRGDLRCSAGLLRIAERALVREAVESASDAYARGWKEFPVKGHLEFALEHNRDVLQTAAGRAFTRRARRGMGGKALHPLWAPRAVALRLSRIVKSWRQRWVGV